jgi:hypothetical protein
LEIGGLQFAVKAPRLLVVAVPVSPAGPVAEKLAPVIGTGVPATLQP